MRDSAAAPKMARLLWWPVRPNSARSITEVTLPSGVGPRSTAAPEGGGEFA
jgi:hypothetical protein